MEEEIIRGFKRWAKNNLPPERKPTRQDAAQFFTDTHVMGKLPAGATWPHVFDILKDRRLFD